MRRRKQIPRRRNLGLKSNVGRFAPLADPRDRSPKIWTWAPPPDMSDGKKNPPEFFQWQGRTFAFPPRAPPESQLQNERMLEPHYSVGIPGGCGGETRQYGIAIGRIWEGFFFSI